MRLGIPILAFLLLLPFTYAVSVDNTTFNTSVSNTSVSVAGFTLNADLIVIDSTSIAFSNITYNITGATFAIPSITFTDQNAVAYNWQFPNISSASSNVVTIKNNLSQNLSNVTITLGTAGITPSSPRLTYPNGSSENPSYVYENGVMSFNATLPSGTSTLLFDTTPYIYNVTLVVGIGAATVSWNTNVTSNSSVRYGTTLSYGQNTGSAALVDYHQVTLTGLNQLQQYFYEIQSCNDADCETYASTFGSIENTEQTGAGCIPGPASLIYALSVLIVVAGLGLGFYYEKISLIGGLTTVLAMTIFILMVVQPC